MRDLSRQCVYMNNDIHNCNATIRELKREKQKYVTVEDRNNNNDNKKKIDNILEQLTREEKNRTTFADCF